MAFIYLLIVIKDTLHELLQIKIDERNFYIYILYLFHR